MKKMLFLSVIICVISSHAFSDTASHSPVLPVIFNMLPGFGIGSFLQGDKQSGTICLTAEAMAVSIAGVGLWSYFQKDNTNQIEPVLCLSVGGLLYIGMKVFGFIMPIKYRKPTNMDIFTNIGNSSMSVGIALNLR